MLIDPGCQNNLNARCHELFTGERIPLVSKIIILFQPCVFSPLMNADAPVFRIIGPLRQKVVQALNVNSSLSDCLLPTVFQPTGIQILAAKLGVYEVLNSQPNKASSASQGELVLNIWEVLGYKRTFMDEINQRRHFDTLLGTLGAIGRNDLKEEVNVRLMSP